MKYGRIIPLDTANGEGIRTSLFVSGCYNHCPGCFNKEAQDFGYGRLYTEETENKILERICKIYVDGLSVLGGDPLCQCEEDLHKLVKLCGKVKTIGKSVWIWTGFTWEYLMQEDRNSVQRAQKELLRLCDIVVDGPFIESKKDLTLAFRGSSNQRIIDVKKSFAAGKVIERRCDSAKSW